MNTSRMMFIRYYTHWNKPNMSFLRVVDSDCNVVYQSKIYNYIKHKFPKGFKSEEIIKKGDKHLYFDWDIDRENITIEHANKHESDNYYQEMAKEFDAEFIQVIKHIDKKKDRKIEARKNEIRNEITRLVEMLEELETE